MKIAIDAHHVGSRMTGSETYVYNLVKNLALLEPNGEKYAVYLESDESVEGMKSNPCFQTRTIQTPRSPVRFGLFYPLESWYESFDIFHAQYALPPFLRGRSVVTVYDMAFERFPRFFRDTIRTQMKLMARLSCQRADHIIT